jgi:hypothetical protein
MTDSNASPNVAAQQAETRNHWGLLVACLLLPTVCYSQKTAASIDPCPQQQFVLVAPEVKLKVLDWGGAGRNLVLLAGGGNTAHVYAALEGFMKLRV